jgi:hypothetical protein
MLTYRGNGAWGTGTGAPLTQPQFDGNTYEFHTRILALETNPPVANSIVGFTLNGTAMSFTLTDSTNTGEFELPVLTFRWMGEWTAAAMYAALDAVTVVGQGVFLTLVDHVAAGSFDAAALGPSVAAGSFVIGRAYIIQTIGTTNFTLIGASANTVGLEFTATGAGSGTGTAAQRLYKQIWGDAQTPAAYSVPTEAGTVTAAAGEKRRIINPAGALTALTLVLPPSPSDGYTYRLRTSQTITTLTVNGAGAETIVGSGFALTSVAEWTYHTATTTWFGP